MADAALEIKIRAVVEGLAKIKELSKNLHGVGTTASTTEAPLGGMSNSLKQLTEGMSKIGSISTTLEEALDKALGPLEVAGEAAKGVTDNLKKLFGTLLAFAGIKLSFDYLKDAAAYAARTETLGITLNVVGRNSGYASSELAGFEERLKKLGITTQASRESMTQMMQAGLALGVQSGQTTSNVERLARASQDLAVVTGQNSSETFNRLIINISQLDSMGLRYMGLMVNIEGAQEKFAAAIGTTAGALSEAQKRQAVMNEVLVQSIALSGAYEESMDTVGKKVQSLSRYKEELSNTVGGKLLPAYGALVDATTLFLKNLELMVKGVDKAGVSSKAYGIGLKDIFSGAMPILEGLLQGIVEFGSAIGPTFIGIGSIIGSVLESFSSLFGALSTGLPLWDTFLLLVRGFAVPLAALADGIKVIEMAFLGITGAISLAGAAIVSLLKLVAKVSNAPDSVVKALDEVEKKSLDMVEKSAKGIRKIYKEFEDGRSNVAIAIDAFNGIDPALTKLGANPAARNLSKEITKLIKDQKELGFTVGQSHEAFDKFNQRLLDSKAAGQISANELRILQAQLGSIGQKASNDVSEAFKKLGFSASEAVSGIDSKFSDAASGLDVLARSGADGAQVFEASFDKILGQASNLESLNKLGEVLKAGFDSGTLSADRYGALIDDLRKKFEALAEQQIVKADSEADLQRIASALGQLSQRSGDVAGKFQISGEQMSHAMELLETKFRNRGIEDGLKRVGLTAEQMEGKSSQAFVQLTASLDSFVSDVNVSGEEFYRVFSKSVVTASSLSDLDLLRSKLDQAFAAGKVSVEEYQSSLANLSVRFNDLFQGSLKAAKTEKDFSLLTAQVRKLGDAGVISREAVTLAMDKIREKATSANAIMSQLVKNTLELAKAQTQVASAQTGVTQADLSVARAKTDVIRAEVKAREDGSELAQAELASAQSRLSVEQARASLSRLELAERIQGEREIAAQQNAARAQQRSELKPGDDTLRLAADLAQKRADSEHRSTQEIQTQIEGQQQNVEAAQQAAYAAQQQEEHLRGVAEASKGVSGVVQRSVSTFQIGNELIARLAGQTSKNIEGFNQAFQVELPKAMDAMMRRFQALPGVIGITDYLISWDGAFKRASAAAAAFADRIASAQAESQRLNDRLDRASFEAKAMNLGITGVGAAFDKTNPQAAQFARHMLEAKMNVAETVKGAAEAARGFANSSANIEIELLQALGQEEEAARRKAEMKREELTIDFQRLKLQIEMAKVQAKIAGVSTVELDKQAAAAEAGYSRALGALAQLDGIEQAKLAKSRQERLAAEREKREAAKAKREGIASPKQGEVSVGFDRGASDARDEAQRAYWDRENRFGDEASRKAQERIRVDAEAQRVALETFYARRNEIEESLAIQGTLKSGGGEAPILSSDPINKGGQDFLKFMAQFGGIGEQATKKIILSAGGKEVPITTPDSAGLLDLLESLSLTSGRN